MPTGPTREEFAAFTTRLYQQMDDGFTGVHSRLDTQNGRLTKGEVADAEIRVRVVSLEKEIFSRGRGRRLSDQLDDEAATSVRFTKRESALIMLGLSIVYALIKLVEVVGSKAFTAIVHGVKP